MWTWVWALIIAAAVGVTLALERRARRREPVLIGRAAGRITRVSEDMRDGRATFYPHVEVWLPNGTTNEIRAAAVGIAPLIGNAVTVAYDPDRPEATAVIVDRTGWQPKPSEISAIVTVILMACAVWTLVGNGSIPPAWYGPLFMLALVSLMMVVLTRGLLEQIPQGARQAGQIRYGLAAFLTFYGFGSFLAQFLAGTGALAAIGVIGPFTEWPVGPVDHVVRDANGTLIVPLTPQGRVQIYDRSGRFVRGWFVEASRGDFRIKPTTDGHIEVHTARGHSRLVYSYEGALLSSTPEDVKAFERLMDSSGELQMTIPFNWLLWPLLGPGWAWITGVVGAFALKRVAKRPRGWH
jgi:hypothetical protein